MLPFVCRLVCRRAALCVLGAAVFSLILSRNVSASSVVVTTTPATPCKNLPSYPTISSAVSSVPAGSTIFICPGTYAEQVVINKNLTLTGEAANGAMGASAVGANNPVIASPSGGVLVNTSDLYGYPSGEAIAAQVLVQTLPVMGVWPAPIVVNISNITVDGSNNGTTCGPDIVGIYYQNASGTVNHVTARFQEFPQADFGCQGGLAIFAESGYGTGTGVATIENSSVHDYDKNGITVDGAGMVATITGNYVVGIGATTLTAQNGIQMSDGARGKITSNTVTGDVYINPSDCFTDNVPCYSATGILLYDSGGASANHVTISSNTVSNTQGGIVVVTDGAETADYNDVSSNKITATPAIVVTGATYLLDGIDLCSDHNTATMNTVFNSSGSGIHLDSQCTEPGSSASGAFSSATTNTINEACAGVLTGNSGGTASAITTFNVVQTTTSGDTCPSGTSAKTAGKAKPQPKRH